MSNSDYSVLIRIFNSEGTLSKTLDCLTLQTVAPSEYIFVDSGSTDKTLDLLPRGSKVHKYIGEEFNYSIALNQGIEYVSTDYVLIISSHTMLLNCEAISYAINLLIYEPNIAATYFRGDKSTLWHEFVNEENFNGYNGLSNTCALIKTSLLRKRHFRPEVFSAEDQEWASWVITKEKMNIARIHGAGRCNINPRKYSLRKRLNEDVAIAYFINRHFLNWKNLSQIILKVVKPVYGFNLKERFYYLVLFIHLVKCKFVEPKAKSRYF